MATPRTTWLPVGDGESVMCQEFGSGRPVCSLIAGVHGDEREGVVALTRLALVLREREVAGTVRLVPIANPPAYHAHSRTSPRDGLNLARVFPGESRGSVTERIAAELTESVIKGSDLLIDLHSAGSEWAMPFFAGFVSVAPDRDSVALDACVAFGAPLVWNHDTGAEGRSLSAARRLGIPAIYVETGGGNRILEADLNRYVDGCLGVLGYLGCIEGTDERGSTDAKLVPGGGGNLDSAIKTPVGGHLVAVREPGDIVAAGEVLFRVFSEVDDEVTEIAAPQDGIVMALRRATNVVAGADLGIIAPVPELLRTNPR